MIMIMILTSIMILRLTMIMITVMMMRMIIIMIMMTIVMMMYLDPLKKGASSMDDGRLRQLLLQTVPSEGLPSRRRAGKEDMHLNF